MNKFTRFLSFALALTLTFTSVDMNVFAAELNEAEPSIVKTEESTSEENTEKPSQQESSDAETSEDQNKSDSNDDNKSNETTNTQEGESNPEEVQEEGEALVEEELEVEEAEEQEMLEEGEGWSIDNDGVLTITKRDISNKEFANNTDVKRIVFSSDVRSIGEKAFAGCTNLKSVVLPEDLQTIGAYAFSNSGVTEVTLNTANLKANTIYTNDRYNKTGYNVNAAFRGCKLDKVTFGNNVVTVPSLFAGANFMPDTEVEFGGNITTIELGAFYDAVGLTTVKFTGKNLKTIGEGAFRYCIDLKNADITEGITTIGNNAFTGCTSIKSVTLPESLDKLGVCAYSSSGVTEVTLNTANLTADTEYILDRHGYTGYHVNAAFRGCKLDKVVFGNNVVTVPSLFAGVDFTPNTEIEFGGKITTIEKGAFYDSVGLTTVKFTGKNLKTIEDGAFCYCSDLSGITIPASVKTIYTSAFAGSGIKYANFDGNTVDFKMNYAQDSAAFANCNFLKEVSLPSNLTYIPGELFYNCKNLQKVVLGSKIKEIGDDAFTNDQLASFYVQKGSATEKALKAYGIPADRIVSMNGITYKLNGGELNGYCPSVYSTQDGSIQIADPIRENYKFAGWFKDAKFTKPTEKSVNGVTTIDVSNQSGNITLYAKWEGPIYTVTLNPGVNATVAITSMEVYKNSTYGKYNDNTDKELPVPSATGKTFKGWFTADGDLVTADTKVTDEAKDQVLYAKYKNNVDTVEAPELLDSNGLTVLPTDEKTDITKFYFKSATADATIIYTVKAENGAASENTYSDGFALEAGKTYTITAYATKENWTDSPKNTWTVTVVDSVSAEDTPDLYKPEYEGKFWVVFQGAIYDETKVSTVYTGANVKLSGYQVYYGKKLLEENKDYKVSYKNNKKIAKYDAGNKAPTMIITGKGNTKGKLELRFNIEGNEDAVKLTNSNTTFELSESSFDYDGTAHTPAVKNLQIKATKKTEAVAIDAKSYTVSYEKNVAAGTAKVVVTFDGKEYFGVLTKNYKINKTDIKNAIEGDKPLVAIEKSNKVSYNNGYNALKSIKNTKTGNDLVLKSEYTISKATVNSKTMTATQTITGKGSFKGSYKLTFDVEKADIKDANVVSFVAPVASTKKGVYKPVAFKVLFDGTLLKGSEYSVKYTVNGQAPSNKVVYGTDAKVVMTITGKGNYVGTKTFEYSPVAGYDISDEAIIDVTVSDAAYTGKANGVNPSIVVKNTYTNKKLANKKDYTVSYKYANETEIKRTAKKKACDYVAEAGEAVKAKDTVPAGTTIIAVIEGKGAYAGKSIEREFRVGYDLSKASVKINPQTYTGKQIIPSKNDITVKVAGKELKANEYNVTIANVENVKAGTGKIIITGTNTSSKQKVVSFKIVARTLSLKDKN